ncbi:MAG: hypothetical protein LLG20_22660 [Acidobacteriales bacterium]|nr:hypothetical protein [Terriglobales bacterium]
MLFHDFIEARTHGRTTLVRIDPRFLAVCEPGTVRVAATCPDIPVTIGARMDAAGVLLTKRWGSPDAVVMIQLVGIRRGFLGKRFPRRSREQFEANEAFINSAYPGTPSPPQA